MASSKYFPEDLSVNEALQLQEEFAGKLVLSDDSVPVNMETIGGAAIYSRGNVATVSVVVLSFPGLNLKEKKVITEEMHFPAIPTCEGFREGRILAKAIQSIPIPPVYMIEGHGINHPRRFGIASHIGLALGLSTIGVTRSLISGRVERFSEKEAVVEGDEARALVVKHTPGSMPLYVSPGNKITLGTAADLVKKTMLGPLPEPIRVATEELQKELMKRISSSRA